MRQLSPTGQKVINDIAQRHGFGVDATLSMLDAVINGGGSMAQFNHAEFGGSGQWMRGGMTMVSDMFNNHLKGRVDALCFELSNLVANEPDLVRSGSFQSQRQEEARSLGQERWTETGHGEPVSARQQASGDSEAVSLFVPPTGPSGDWWPADLRRPNSTGAQDGVRYAYFAQARRLAIDVGGAVTVYDTLDHHIGGFSQQQSVGGTLSFSSQHGLIDVATLPVVSSSSDPARPPATQPARYRPDNASEAAATPPGVDHDVFATIEKLANLRARGIISDEEFQAKKADLLSRV